MRVGCHKHDAGESAGFQIREQIVVGRLALGVGDRNGHDLSEAVVSHAVDDQHAVAHHASGPPHLLVAGVHEQVGPGVAGQTARAPGLKLGVEPAAQCRDRGL